MLLEALILAVQNVPPCVPVADVAQASACRQSIAYQSHVYRTTFHDRGRFCVQDTVFTLGAGEWMVIEPTGQGTARAIIHLARGSLVLTDWFWDVSRDTSAVPVATMPRLYRVRAFTGSGDGPGLPYSLVDRDRRRSLQIEGSVLHNDPTDRSVLRRFGSRTPSTRCDWALSGLFGDSAITFASARSYDRAQHNRIR